MSTSASRRFSKRAALDELDRLSAMIADAQRFDRSWGTAQLRTGPRDSENEAEDELIRRAVEYGRMRAFEQFAEMIESGL